MENYAWQSKLLKNQEATLPTVTEFYHTLNQIILDSFKDLNNPCNGIGTMEQLKKENGQTVTAELFPDRFKISQTLLVLTTMITISL